MELMGLGSILRNRIGARGLSALAALVVAAGLGGAMPVAHAADEADKPAVNAVTGSAWQSEIKPAEAAGESNLPPEQLEVVDKINAYLQTYTDLEGRFVQTNPDGATQKGSFWMLRPGMMRFDYAKPSEMRIVCDGKYLSIEDHDLKTMNRYPIETTPFRMLMTADVKLQRDTRILSVSNSETSASITLADKTGQSAGQIQLFFAYPNLELKEWTITDAQGLNTRIEIANVEFNKGLKADYFAPSTVGLAKAFGGQYGGQYGK